MEERNLDINLQSYAAVLECLGRIKSVTSDITEKVLQDIEKKVTKWIAMWSIVYSVLVLAVNKCLLNIFVQRGFWFSGHRRGIVMMQ